MSARVLALSAYAVPNVNAPVARLDANECPYPLSQRTVARAAQGLDALHRYPDYTQLHAALQENIDAFWLRDCLPPKATKKMAPASSATQRDTVFGVGSDELIVMLLDMVCATNAKILVPTPTFSMYRLSAQIRGMACVQVPLDETFDLDVERMLRAIAKHKPKLVFLASPNNPTGNRFSRDRIAQIADCTRVCGGLTVIDEAYVAYAADNSLRMHPAWANRVDLVFITTLSKVGLAGLRVGAMNISHALALELNKVRLPYNMPTSSMVLATRMLAFGKSELARNFAKVLRGRAQLQMLLTQRGFFVYPSDSNILLTRAPKGRSAQQLGEALRQRGVLVRTFSQPRLRDCLRVSVGTKDEHAALASALDALLNVRVDVPRGRT